MRNTLAHIAATEGRTLCGLRVTQHIRTPEPWASWLSLYQADPSKGCPKCRRVALRSADRTIAIRFADQQYRLNHRDPSSDTNGQ